MHRIASLIPEAGKVNEAGLRALDADVVARFAIDARNPWWRRRPCVLALRDRVPAHRLRALIARACDDADVPEVRVSLLDILGDRAELLPWLRAQTAEQKYGVHEAILKARGALGDLSAAPALATLANDPWDHRRALGRAALDALVARHGRATVVAAVGVARPEDRVFQVRNGGDILAALADPDVDVAREACELAVARGVPDDAHLLDHVVTGPTTESRLWAAYALHGRGHDIRELWHAIDRPRVEIAGLDDAIRLAILREYPGIGRTDPRWHVERACVELPPPPDEADQLARLATALDAAGLAPGPPISAGDEYEQGAGTYHAIALGGGGTLTVSTLGPYVTGDAASPARAVLERAGFRWIDAAIGTLRVEGLCIYHFGTRAPQQVRTLLFYWQD